LNKAEEILKKKEELKKIYEKISKNYTEKIDGLQKRIKDISDKNVDETNFIERRRELEKIAEEDAKLRAQVVEGYAF